MYDQRDRCNLARGRWHTVYYFEGVNRRSTLSSPHHSNPLYRPCLVFVHLHYFFLSLPFPYFFSSLSPLSFSVSLQWSSYHSRRGTRTNLNSRLAPLSLPHSLAGQEHLRLPLHPSFVVSDRRILQRHKRRQRTSTL